MIALVVGGYLTLVTEPSNNGAIAALGLSFVLIAPGVFSLNRYYARKFGRQVVSPPRHPGRLLFIWSAYMVVSWILNARYEAIPAGAPTLSIVAFASIGLVIRDWPWRAYYLLAPMAVAIGFFASAPIGGVLPPNMTVGVIFMLLGASMVVIGLLDHLLLVKLMKEARESQPAAATNPSSLDA